MFEKEIEEILVSSGASLVGFCSLESVVNAPYPYAITIAYKLSDAVLKTITDSPTMPYFQHYRIVNTKLDLLALDCVRFIENKGYSAFPVAGSQSTGQYHGYFPHKTGAVLSGLGYIGRNCLLITPEYGSKVRLATVLTDMPVTRQRPLVPFLCGDCTACVTACKGGAISGKAYDEKTGRDGFFDAEKCSNHMKTFKDIGRGAVCGACIKVCPKNGLGY